MYVEKRRNELEGKRVQGVGVRSLCGKVEESVKYVLRRSAGKELSNVIAQSPLQFAQKNLAFSFIQWHG
jgi:hypothetical protein